MKRQFQANKSQCHEDDRQFGEKNKIREKMALLSKEGRESDQISMEKQLRSITRQTRKYCECVS